MEKETKIEDNTVLKELEEKYNEDEVFNKEINQVKNVEPVTRALSDMGAFYKAITTKLKKDGICYITKEKLEEEFDIVQVPDNKVDKGMIAFVAISKKVNTTE